MRRIIKKILIVFLPLLLILFFIETRLRKIKTIYERKKEVFENNIKNIDILILGNSHGRDAIIPKVLSNSAYNLSLPAQSIFYNDKILEKYMPHMKSLKTVIMTIDYHSMYFIDQELSAFHNDKVFGVKKDGYHYWLTGENLSYFFFVYGALPSLSYLFHSPEPVTLIDGWQPEPSADSTMLNNRSSILRANDHNRLVKRNNNLKYDLSKNLERILFLLHKNHIQVLLISTPVYKSYFNKLDKKVMIWNEVTINSAAAKSRTNYYNFMNDQHFTDIDFSDVDHLSTIGAKKFSLMIKKCIRNDK